MIQWDTLNELNNVNVCELQASWDEDNVQKKEVTI